MPYSGGIVKKHQEIRTLRRVITTTQQIQEETSKSFYSTFRDASFSVGSRQSARERERSVTTSLEKLALTV